MWVAEMRLKGEAKQRKISEKFGPSEYRYCVSPALSDTLGALNKACILRNGRQWLTEESKSIQWPFALTMAYEQCIQNQAHSGTERDLLREVRSLPQGRLPLGRAQSALAESAQRGPRGRGG